MEKLVRLGIKKLQGAHDHYMKYSNGETIPELPPLSDVVTKFLLRSPRGQDLRSRMLEFYINEDPDKNYFRAGLSELIKFCAENRNEILQEAGKSISVQKKKRVRIPRGLLY